MKSTFGVTGLVVQPVMCHPVANRIRDSLIATPRIVMGLLLATTLVTKLLWGGVMGASTNEAYCYLYTVHPALSYFDHPPMMMWVAKAGQVLCHGWVHPFSIRLGFVLLFVGSTWVLYRWTSRWYGPWAGVYAAVLLNLSGFYAVTGGFATPDGPLLFFSLLTMWALSEAILADPYRTRPWAYVGLALAGALLSKYHAVFLPAGVVFYAIVTPGARHLFRRPGPYVAMGIALLGFLPVIAWNARHGWVSFVFQGGRATEGGFHFTHLAGALFGPVLCLLPWVWGILVMVLVARVRRFGSTSGQDRLAMCQAIAPLVFFTAIGCSRWVMMHWPLIGYLPLFPLAGAKLAEWANVNARRTRRRMAMMAVPLLVGALFLMGRDELGLAEPPASDGFAEARGWDSVAAELIARGVVNDPAAFVFTDDWRDSARLGFALRNRVSVLCYSGDSRGFGFWSEPAEWIGKTGYWVEVENDPIEVQLFRMLFTTVELVAEFPMRCGNTVLKHVRVFRCARQHTAFPFGHPAF